MLPNQSNKCDVLEIVWLTIKKKKKNHTSKAEVEYSMK